MKRWELVQRAEHAERRAAELERELVLLRRHASPSTRDVVRMAARVERLENVLRAHGIPVPPVDPSPRPAAGWVERNGGPANSPVPVVL